ncbi:hypothetical protein SANTM175S_06630 [Streptomyces antimycoticus]
MIAWFGPECTSGTRVLKPATVNAGQSHYSVLHAGAPFDGEAEGQPGLGDERGAGAPGLARTCAVHRTERPCERLAQAVAVAHRDLQQRLAAEHLHALALVGRVEGERGKAPLGQASRVQSRGLLLTPLPGWPTTIAGRGPGAGVSGR